MKKRATVEWDERRSAIENARTHLGPLVSAFFAEGRETLAHAPGNRQLHSFRLRTKRLRYTLELFRECYGPGLGERLAALQDIQTRLGEINDCDTTMDLLAGMLPATSQHRTKAERFLEARADEHTKKFAAYWRDVFDRPGQEQWWLNYLARNTNGRRGAARR